MSKRQAAEAVLLNAQFDFNLTAWPFAAEVFDLVVANMSLHHIAEQKRQLLMDQLYTSLRPGGKALITDVYTKSEDGARFTYAGLRGPVECGGEVRPFVDFLTDAIGVGFGIDSLAQQLVDDGRSAQSTGELEVAKNDCHATMAISKSVRYTELSKDGE